MALTKEEILRRRSTVGGSDVPIILGLSKWKTPHELYAEKHSTEPPIASPDSEASRWGQKLERIILQAWGEARCQGVDPWLVGPMSHDDIPWATCTPDGWTALPGHGIEIKNRAYGTGWGESGTQEIPPDVEAQVRWSMFVADCEQWGVGVLLGGNNFRHYLIERDKEWEEWVFPVVEAFRAGSLVDDALWKPVVTSGSIRRGGTLDASAVHTYLFLKKESEETSLRLKKATETLKELVGEDKGFDLPDGRRVLYTPTKGRATTDWEAVARKMASMYVASGGESLDRCIEACTTTGRPYRRLTVTERKVPTAGFLDLPTEEKEQDGL